jgi:hypothetical protein
MNFLPIIFLFASTAVLAEPATDETIEQLSEIIIASMLILAVVLGFIAGQQR